MNAEQYRALVTKLENIQAGRSLVRTYTGYNPANNRMGYTESWTLGEGEIGRKIGSIFGKAGADLGDKIGDFFGGTDEPTGTNKPSTTFDKSMGDDDYQKPQGSDSGFSGTGNDLRDKYGLSADDYVPTTKLVPVTAQLSLKSPGAFADEIQSMYTTRTTDQRVTQSWDYKGATLALVCGDRSSSSEGNQGTMGVWLDPTNMAITGNEYAEDLFKQHGYKLLGDRTTSTSNGLGNLLVNEFTARKGSNVVISVEAMQMVSFAMSGGKKGLQVVSAHFIGPRAVWEEQGGKSQFRQLLSAMKLNGVAPLSSSN